MCQLVILHHSFILGEVLSTESTYKYKMQVQQSIPDSPAQVQGPLKANLKPVKRRNPSQASSTDSAPHAAAGGEAAAASVEESHSATATQQTSQSPDPGASEPLGK